MKFVSTLARHFCGNYSLYRIYSQELTAALRAPSATESSGEFRCVDDIREIDGAADPRVRALESYAAPRDAYAFGAWMGSELASLCWVWTGDLYRTRNFWPLRVDEAKLVQIVTAEGWRGRGLAPLLIRYAAVQMRDRQFRRLFARIWHSNHPSQAAFRKAGWSQQALVAEIDPLCLGWKLRFVWRRPFGRRAITTRESTRA